MKVTCDACGAPHDLAPPPWVVASGRPFRMTCAACGAQQEVHPTGLQVLESGSVQPPRTVTLDEAPTLSEVSGGFHRVRPSTVDTIPAGEVSGPQLAMPSPSAASNRPHDEAVPLAMPAAQAASEPFDAGDVPAEPEAFPEGGGVGFAAEVTAPSHEHDGPDPDALDAPPPPAVEPSLWRTQPDHEDDLPPTQSDEPVATVRDSGAWIPGGISLPDPGMDERGGRHYRRITAPDDDEPPRGGGAFLLRQEGDLFHVPDLATLQRWVMEHRVAPTDDLSERGAPWHKAGARDDLRVFFEAVAQLDASVGGEAAWRDPAVRPLGAGGALPPLDDGPGGDPTQESLPIPTEELRDPGLDAPPVPGHLRRGLVPRSVPPRPSPPPVPGPPEPDEFDVPTPPSAGPPVLLAEDADTPGAGSWDPVTPAPVAPAVVPASVDPFDEAPPPRRSSDRAPMILVAVAALVVLGGGALLWLDRAQQVDTAPVIPVQPEVAAVVPRAPAEVAPVDAAPVGEPTPVAVAEAPDGAAEEAPEAEEAPAVEAEGADETPPTPAVEPTTTAEPTERPAAPAPRVAEAPARAPRPAPEPAADGGSWVDEPAEAPPQPRPRVPDAASRPTAWVEVADGSGASSEPPPPTPVAASAAVPSPWGAIDDEPAEPVATTAEPSAAAAVPEVVLSPLDAMGYDQLVAFGWEALESDVPLAIDAFERAIRQRPGGADAHLGLGTSLMTSGRRVQGARHLCTARPTVSDRDRLDIDGMLAANGQECP